MKLTRKPTSAPACPAGEEAWAAKWRATSSDVMSSRSYSICSKVVRSNVHIRRQAATRSLGDYPAYECFILGCCVVWTRILASLRDFGTDLPIHRGLKSKARFCLPQC